MVGTGSTRVRVVCVLALLAAFVHAEMASPAGAAPAPAWSATVTSPTDTSRVLKSISSTGAAATVMAVVDPGDRHQIWRGVGASLSDSSVAVLRTRDDAQAMLFGPSRTDGARLNWIRLPLSPTDYSTNRTYWGWSNGVATPPPAAVQAVAVLKANLGRRPDLAVVATPWSAPKSMRRDANDPSQPVVGEGGALASSSVVAYADLLVAQADWLLANGVPLRAMTLGNEPNHQTPDYPTMKMSDDQMLRLAGIAGPKLQTRGVELWALDHNYDDADEAGRLMRSGSFAASAFHCYAGNPSQIASVPSPIITECTGTNDNAKSTFAWDARELVHKAVNAGSTGLFFWNLALDHWSGPKLPGGCPDRPHASAGNPTCRGLLTVNTTTGTVTREPEFFTLAHLSRAARPGAVRIGASSLSGDAFPVVAFDNLDGSVGVFAQNGTGSDQVLGIRLLGGQEVRFAIRDGEMVNLRVPFTDAAQGQWAKGKVVRSPQGLRYYVDKTGFRHFIRSEAIFACHGGEANTIDVAVWGDVTSTIPETEQAECFLGRGGNIIRHPDGDSYVLEKTAAGLVRHWIPSANDYVCARAENRKVVAVTRYQVAETPASSDRPDAHCIIRGPGGDAHYVNDQGRREWMPDSPTWDCEVGRGVRVLDVSAAFVLTVDEAGWHYCLNKANLRGKVLRHADGDASYVHPDDTRTWIPDSPTWDCRLRQGKAVVDTRWREYVNAFPDTGWDYCYDVNTLKNRIISHPDGDSHHVDGSGVRHWIPTQAIFNCLRARGIPADTVRWREYITNTPEGSPAACS